MDANVENILRIAFEAGLVAGNPEILLTVAPDEIISIHWEEWKSKVTTMVPDIKRARIYRV